MVTNVLFAILPFFVSRKSLVMSSLYIAPKVRVSQNNIFEFPPKMIFIRKSELIDRSIYPFYSYG